MQQFLTIRTLIISVLLAGFGLSGCGSTGGASGVRAEVLPTQSATELLRLSGSGGPYTSSPLYLPAEVILRVSWEQSSTGEFSFGLTNVTQDSSTPNDLSSDVSDATVTFELVLGPSSGSGDSPFLPGEYVVQITSADGPWLIWIETIEDA